MIKRLADRLRLPWRRRVVSDFPPDWPSHYLEAMTLDSPTAYWALVEEPEPETLREARYFEAHVSLHGGPRHHVAFQGDRAYLDGVLVAEPHEIVTALRQHAATPEQFRTPKD